MSLISESGRISNEEFKAQNDLFRPPSSEQNSVLSQWENLDSGRLNQTFPGPQIEPYLLEPDENEVKEESLKGFASLANPKPASPKTPKVRKTVAQLNSDSKEKSEKELEEKKIAYKPTWSQAVRNITAEDNINMSLRPTWSVKNLENDEDKSLLEDHKQIGDEFYETKALLENENKENVDTSERNGLLDNGAFNGDETEFTPLISENQNNGQADGPHDKEDMENDPQVIKDTKDDPKEIEDVEDSPLDIKEMEDNLLDNKIENLTVIEDKIVKDSLDVEDTKDSLLNESNSGPIWILPNDEPSKKKKKKKKKPNSKSVSKAE